MDEKRAMVPYRVVQGEVVDARAGKRDSASTNAVTHGLRSPRPVVTGWESADEWEEFLAAVLAALKCRNVAEAAIGERLASVIWRLRRVNGFESAVIADRVAQAAELGKPELGMFLPADVVDRVTRYESHLSREIVRALAALVALRGVTEEGTQWVR